MHESLGNLSLYVDQKFEVNTEFLHGKFETF
jgi:hypothetical protein